MVDDLSDHGDVACARARFEEHDCIAKARILGLNDAELSQIPVRTTANLDETSEI